jgi:Tfp pilus assembly protein FimT
MPVRDPNNAGRTLLQVLVGIALLGFVLAASIPAARAYLQSRALTTAGDQLADVCRRAQTRAIQSNHAVFVEIQPETDSIALVEDTNDNGLCDAGETYERIPLAGGLDLASTTLPEGRLMFDARGRSSPGGDVLLRVGPAAAPHRFEVPAPASGADPGSLRLGSGDQ